MRKTLLVGTLIALPFLGMAQSHPQEWEAYTSNGYFYNIQSDHNNKGLSETQFKSQLLDIARTNLARQIQIQVTEQALLNKQSIKGRTSIDYTSTSQFKTNVNLKLVEAKTYYNPLTQEGHAIAYINKGNGITYYRYEINQNIEEIKSHLSIADNYVQTGFKKKAKEELECLNTQFNQIDEAITWLGILGLTSEQSVPLLNHVNQLKQQVTGKVAELQHSIVICISCNATVFEKPYPSLQNELKGILAQEGCSFTTNPQKADWVIKIKASTREYNNKDSFYFAYADASISITKQLTSQCIYEDEISKKGGHTLGFTEAARKAYKSLSNPLGKAILEIIKQ